MPARPEANVFPGVTVVAVDWSGRAGGDQIHHIRAAIARDGAPQRDRLGDVRGAAVRNLAVFAGISIEEATIAATTVPARLLGLDWPLE